MSFNWRRLLAGALLACAFSAGAQTIPCRNTILLTRQNPANSPETFLSSVSFLTSGSVSIINTDTITSKNLNASVYYNGYVWAHDWTGSSSSGNFQLLKIGDQTSSVVTPTPTITNATMGTTNNACVDASGVMYIMSGLNLYMIDLSQATPTVLNSGGSKTCTMSPIQNTTGHNWGDLAVDPTDGTIYAWYHPTSALRSPGFTSLRMPPAPHLPS